MSELSYFLRKYPRAMRDYNRQIDSLADLTETQSSCEVAVKYQCSVACGGGGDHGDGATIYWLLCA